MNSDAFERFERSRSGLLIPLLLFAFGAVATVIAINAVGSVALKEAERAQQRPPAEVPPLQDGGS